MIKNNTFFINYGNDKFFLFNTLIKKLKILFIETNNTF